MAAKINAWGEPFPYSHQKVTSISLSVVKEIRVLIKSATLPKLRDLYEHDTNGQLRRNVEIFAEFKWLANAPFQEKENKEFMGLYIFVQRTRRAYSPVYVGISRTVFRRLRQHGWGKKHNEASLAYLIGKAKAKHKGWRDKLKKKYFNNAKRYIQSLSVVLYPIKKDYDLYFIEVFAAGYWKTKWNTFKTH